MRTTLCVLMLMMISVSVSAAPKATLTVLPECNVTGAICTIGDVAQVGFGDAGTVQRVKALTVCSSPLPGKSREISRAQVVIAMRRGKISDDAYELRCPTRINLVRTQAMITGQMLFNTAKSFAESAIRWPGTTAVEPGRLPADQSVPVGKLELRVKSDTQNVRKGQNSIPVEIAVDGNVYRMIQVTVMVKVLAPVLVATKAIARSEALSSANTALEMRDITRLPDDICLEAPGSDMTASLPISQGSMIRKQWIVAPPAVKAGDAVIVIVESDGVRVSDKGTAVQDGRPGDQIKVRLGKDAREIRGTIAEPGIVKISIGRRSN